MICSIQHSEIKQFPLILEKRRYRKLGPTRSVRAASFRESHFMTDCQKHRPPRGCDTDMPDAGRVFISQDGATNRFAVARVTLRRGESSGAEPHTKGKVAHV